ncbi:large subunit GTPase 1 homolog [Ornithodoros turicata]|uniref:large subunit GTPase 1 homolog n=1 Tax=Ornithodoros turicata TaxID=34597 RepID=UPI003139C6D5
MTKKKGKTQLGRSLIKAKGNKFQNASSLHTTELNDGYDWGRANVTSITEQNDLDEFLATAELAGTDFTAEKLNVRVVQGNATPGILSQNEKADLEILHQKHKQFLKVPRRPHWDETTTPEELHALEKEAFINWRRELSELQDAEGIILTPYEKNLEFWRQLWRVVERSDVVVQIVDARNPLLFYCEDLVRYVAEVGPHKKSMVLLNKCDLLTGEQRKAWAEYLTSIGIHAVFFSALLESEEAKEGSLEADDEMGSTDDECSDESSDESSYESLPESLYETCDESCPSPARNTPLHTKDAGEGPLKNTCHLHTKEELLQLFKTVHTGPKVKEGMTVIGLVGYPNVGKSSTINALLQSKKVSVSTTPGKTKHFQTLHLDEELCLCDCPGLVFPNFVSNKAEMIVNGILPIDRMTDHVPPINIVASLIPRHILECTYGIMLPPPHETENPDRPPNSEELLNAYGYMRGYMTPSGVPDNPRSSRYILKDFVNGKLVFCTAPPGVPQDKYHVYPPDSRTKASTTGTQQPRKEWARKTTSRDIDKDFFKKRESQVHSKGKTCITSSAQVPSTAGSSSEVGNSKPWKKHHNTKKREKLRRVYAAHDL